MLPGKGLVAGCDHGAAQIGGGPRAGPEHRPVTDDQAARHGKAQQTGGNVGDAHVAIRAGIGARLSVLPRAGRRA